MSQTLSQLAPCFFQYFSTKHWSLPPVYSHFTRFWKTLLFWECWDYGGIAQCGAFLQKQLSKAVFTFQWHCIKPHPTLPLKWLFYRKSLNQYFCKFLERYSVCFSNILMEHFLSDNFKIFKWPSAACGLSNSLMKKPLQPFAEHKECGKISWIWPPKCILLVTQPKHVCFV